MYLCIFTFKLLQLKQTGAGDRKGEMRANRRRGKEKRREKTLSVTFSVTCLSLLCVCVCVCQWWRLKAAIILSRRILFSKFLHAQLDIKVGLMVSGMLTDGVSRTWDVVWNHFSVGLWQIADRMAIPSKKKPSLKSISLYSMSDHAIQKELHSMPEELKTGACTIEANGPRPTTHGGQQRQLIGV